MDGFLSGLVSLAGMLACLVFTFIFFANLIALFNEGSYPSKEGKPLRYYGLLIVIGLIGMLLSMMVFYHERYFNWF